MLVQKLKCPIYLIAFFYMPSHASASTTDTTSNTGSINVWYFLQENNSNKEEMMFNTSDNTTVGALKNSILNKQIKQSNPENINQVKKKFNVKYQKIRTISDYEELENNTLLLNKPNYLFELLLASGEEINVNIGTISLFSAMNLSFKLKDSDTVLNLKNKIQERIVVDVSCQRLFLEGSGSELENNTRIYANRIKNNSTLTLHVTPLFINIDIALNVTFNKKFIKSINLKNLECRIDNNILTLKKVIQRRSSNKAYNINAQQIELNNKKLDNNYLLSKLNHDNMSQSLNLILSEDPRSLYHRYSYIYDKYKIEILIFAIIVSALVFFYSKSNELTEGTKQDDILDL